MQARIELAARKGCDGMDADNTDVFNDDSGLGGGFVPPLNENDTIEFIQKLSNIAHGYGMGFGIKNAEDIFPSVLPMIDYAVNEECATYGCSPYEQFIAQGKPVFHIEYANYRVKLGTDRLELKSWYPNWQTFPSAQVESLLCLETAYNNPDPDYATIKPEIGRQLSTVIKSLDLDTFVLYCDGSWVSG